MIRTLTILTTVWVLAIPMLCLGGVFEHACTDCDQEEVCSHEEDCPDDPCGKSVATTRTSNDVASTIALAPAVIVNVDDRPLEASDHLTYTPPRAERNLPRPISDLPLLI